MKGGRATALLRVGLPLLLAGSLAAPAAGQPGEPARVAPLAGATWPSELEGKPVLRLELRTVGGQWQTKEPLPPDALGGPFSAEYARRLTRRLLGTGRYAAAEISARAEPPGVILTVRLVPQRVVGEVSLWGTPALPELARDALGLSAGDAVTVEQLGAAENSIRAAYRARGYPNATARVRGLETQRPKEVSLLVEVDAGSPSRISARQFEVPGPDRPGVRKLLTSYGVDRGDRGDEVPLREADRALAEALRRAGYPNAEVSHGLSGDPATPQLRVRVEPGTGRSFELEGNQRFASDLLRAAIAAQVQGGESPTRVREAALGFYVARGFLDAQVDVVTRDAPGALTQRFVLAIREGRQVEVERRVFPCLSGARSAAALEAEIDSFLSESLPGGDLIGSVPAYALDGHLAPQSRHSRRATAVQLEPWRTFSPEVYEQALEHLQQVYRAEGYLSARVGPATLVRRACDPKVRSVCLPVGVRRLPPEACAHVPETDPDRGNSEASYTCRPEAGAECEPGATVSIPVRLGPQTLLWDLSFEGNVKFGDRELSRVSGLVPGSPLSEMDLEAARRRLLEHYANAGYAFANIELTRQMSADDTRARATFSVLERQPVRIRELTVRGAQHTDIDLILDRAALVPGGLYRRDLAEATEEQLAQLGVFSSVSVNLEAPQVPAREKTAVIQVNERLPQYLDLSPGFSTGQGLRIAFEYGHQNLAERAIRLLLRVQLGYLPAGLILEPTVRSTFQEVARTQSLSFLLQRSNLASIEFPEVGLGPLYQLKLEGLDARDIFLDFARDKRAAVVTLTYRPQRTLALSLAGALELNEATIFENLTQPSGAPRLLENLVMTNPSPALVTLLNIPEGLTLAVSQRLGFTWDRRDTPFAATRGTFVSLGVEHVNAYPVGGGVRGRPDAQAGDSSHFLHFAGRLAGYLRLSRRGLALAASAGFGFNQQLRRSSQTYPDRYFFLGGVDSLRGFLFSSVLPEDIAQDIARAQTARQQAVDGDPSAPGEPPSTEDRVLRASDVPIRGGDLLLNPRLELRVPLWGAWQTAAFVDAGNLWLDARRFADSFRLRYAAGAGLRVSTPVGPLALDYGLNLSRRRSLGEGLGAFHFSIGLF